MNYSAVKRTFPCIFVDPHYEFCVKKQANKVIFAFLVVSKSTRQKRGNNLTKKSGCYLIVMEVHTAHGAGVPVQRVHAGPALRVPHLQRSDTQTV